MSESMRPYDGQDRSPYRTGGGNNPASLADVLERVLDKGVVIAGDIQVRLLDIELLTIKIRLLIASVDKAKEMGINWWESDPFVSTQSLEDGDEDGAPRELQQRVEVLESRLKDLDDGGRAKK
jgi:Gas vesicle protein